MLLTKKFRSVSQTHPRLPITCTALIAGHCRLRPNQGCRATLSLTCKDRSLRGRTLAVQPHRKGTEWDPNQTRCHNGRCSFFSSSFSLFFLTFLPHCTLCIFFCIPALGETKGDARQTILEQDLSSLQRWSHSAVRETTFKTSSPPFPHLHSAVNDSMLLAGCTSLILSIRERALIIAASC